MRKREQKAAEKDIIQEPVVKKKVAFTKPLVTKKKTPPSSDSSISESESSSEVSESSQSSFEHSENSTPTFITANLPVLLTPFD